MPRHLATRVATLLLALVGWGSSALSAQQRVVGEVVGGDDGAPVEGAMVLLIADAGGTVASVLSAADGSFGPMAAAPGTYRLRVDRIGYASTLSDPFELAAGATVRLQIKTAIQAIRLSGLEVGGARRCALAPEQGTPTATVWEEARKALAAASWTSDREMYRLTWMRYTRDLEAATLRVENERRRRTRAYTARPFQSVDMGELETYGFMRPDGDGFVFRGPDAEVLLSDFFLRGHCLSVVRERDRIATRIGLRFAPVPGSRLPDIEGTIWLDEGSGRLRSVEYDYVNLGRRAPVEGRDASGRLAFRELPNGTWIVEDWNIRMPLLAERRSASGGIDAFVVAGYREEGGSITEVSTRTGLVLDGVVTGVHGTVTDSLGEPAAGASVRIVGAGLETATDEDGVFTLTDVSPGRWSVRATHPELDAFGYAGVDVQVDIARNQLRPLRLGLPSVRALLTARCEGRPATVLAGRVLDVEGRAIPGGSVRVTWSRGRSTEGLAVPVDGSGVFVACAVPAGAELRAEAVLEGNAEGPVTTARVTREEGFTLVSLGASDSRGSDLDARRGPDAPSGADPLPSDGATTAWLHSVGFYLRSSMALGSFDRDDILPRDSIPELLAEVPELAFRRAASGYTTLHRMPPDALPGDTTTLCELDDFYMNGQLVKQRLRDNWEAQIVRRFPPRHVAGLEVFTGANAPVGPPDACGATLLWVPLQRSVEDPPFVGELSGALIVGEPQALEGLVVRAVPGDHRATVDAEGAFSFASMPPATYRLEVVLPEWGTFAQEVVVRAFAHTRVRIEVAPREEAGTSASGSARPPPR